MAITPGAYLRRRREAAELTRDDVALMLATDPAVAAITRAEWLALIEADAMPIAAVTVDALERAFAFDRHVLERLGAIHYGGSTLPAPRLCRVCACGEWDPCIGRDGGDACSWAGPDLCSECVGPDASGLALPMPGNDSAAAGAAA